MGSWQSPISLDDPFWQDYCEPLVKLDSEAFPTAEQLCRLLPDGVRNQKGLPIQFVPSEQVPETNYEVHIYETGQVSTREQSWHDLFNALAWCRFPKLKSAMNASHMEAMSSGCEPGRGKRRDALTLFDECGVIIAASNPEPLDWLARRNWPVIFQEQKETWERDIQIFVPGHAMLEKFLSPYKSMTANAILVYLAESRFTQSREDLRACLDAKLAEQLNAGELLRSSKDLSPVPLMGIPGWWTDSAQDQAFYADKQVFRPAPENLLPAPVFSLV